MIGKIGPAESTPYGWTRRWPGGHPCIVFTDRRCFGGRGFRWYVNDEAGAEVAQGQMDSMVKAAACAHAVVVALGWLHASE